MGAIPEDIRLLSDLLARRHEERKFGVGGQTSKALAADIAKALIGERERCAKIAEDQRDCFDSLYAEMTAESIRDAIRSPA